ncbi:MAG: MFS transporter [bacterium]|jgi:DHA3 family macrolide efflux protein-like MFS transporter
MRERWKKDAALFLASQILSLFGSTLVQYAIMWYITLNTKSGLMMTVSIICGFLPTFFLSPFAGVWADRYDRKLLIMLSDAFIAATTLLAALMFYGGHGSLCLLFAMSVFRAIGTGVQMPAVGAFLPQIVPGEQLTRVNGINGSLQAAVTLASPMLSGALMTVATIEAIFFIDVATAAAAILVLLLFLRVPSHGIARTSQQLSYFRDLSDGFVYIRGHSFLGKFLLFNAVFLFLVAPAAFLTPLQVARTFGGEVWRLTAIEVAFSLGMMLGGAVIAAWGGFKNKVHTITFAAFCNSVGVLALGAASLFWLYLLIMFIIGIMMPLFNVPATVLLQEKVEANFIGRVFGVQSMLASSTMPLGMLVFGPVADVVRIEWLLIGTGFLMFLQSFFLLGKDIVAVGE